MHDSSFEEIGRHGQNLKMSFDWAKLENFKEASIDECIVLGKTTMFLTGVHSEQFKTYDTGDNTQFVLGRLPDDY